ncbi:hypothetical protein PUN28_017993 [Cardiocondyla obscurior]|uniref:Uncharacterized protein n=1 Tax=Cardiocondyla obscurior TaxID=286306 RepID=A0AAW2EGU6_9HYME
MNCFRARFFHSPILKSKPPARDCTVMRHPLLIAHVISGQVEGNLCTASNASPPACDFDRQFEKSLARIDNVRSLAQVTWHRVCKNVRIVSVVTSSSDSTCSSHRRLVWPSKFFSMRRVIISPHDSVGEPIDFKTRKCFCT